MGQFRKKLKVSASGYTPQDAVPPEVVFAPLLKTSPDTNLLRPVTDLAEIQTMPTASRSRLVISLLENPQADLAGMIREAKRVLKPEGELAFVVRHPFFNRPGSVLRLDANRAYSLKQAGHYFDGRYPTASEFIRMPLKAGLTVTHVDEPRPESLGLTRWHPDYKHRLDPWSYGAYALVVHARKLTTRLPFQTYIEPVD